MKNQVINRNRSKFAGVLTSLFYVVVSLVFALLIIWGIHLIREIADNNPISWLSFLPDIPFLTNILFPFASYLGVHAGIIMTVLSSLLFIFSVFGFVSCTMIIKFSKLNVSQYKKVYKLINFNVFILFVLFFILLDITIVNAFTGEMKLQNIALIFVSFIPLICALLFLADKQKNKKLEAELENLSESYSSDSFSLSTQEIENESEWVFSLEENKSLEENQNTQNNLQPREIVEDKKDTSFFNATPNRPVIYEENSKAPPLPPKPPTETSKSSEDLWVDFNFNIDGKVENINTTHTSAPKPPPPPRPPLPSKQPTSSTMDKSRLDIIQDKLMELRNLLAVGAITREEFEEERDKLISQI